MNVCSPKAKGLKSLGSSYRSCRPPPRRRRISPCGTSSSETSPPPSQRCTALGGCRWGWCCWSGCSTTPSCSPVGLCRRVWPPSWSPRTSSLWSPRIRQKQTPQSWGWAPEKPAARALASWSRQGQRRWNEKATNPGFWYVATVFRLPADISNLHNLVTFGAPWVRSVYIPLPALLMCCHLDERVHPLHSHRDNRNPWHYWFSFIWTRKLSPLCCHSKLIAPPLLQSSACNIIHYKWQIIVQTSFEHISKKQRLQQA